MLLCRGCLRATKTKNWTLVFNQFYSKKMFWFIVLLKIRTVQHASTRVVVTLHGISK